jgi:Zn-dependent protease
MSRGWQSGDGDEFWLVGGTLKVPVIADGVARMLTRVIAPWTVLLLWSIGRLLHETGHAIAIYTFASPQARQEFKLTRYPWRYWSLWQSWILPSCVLTILSLPLPGSLMGGNARYLPVRWQRSVVAIAGPIVTLGLLVLLWICMFAYDAFYSQYFVWFRLELVAFSLNLLPLPGLASYAVIEPWLPIQWQRQGNKIRPYSQLMLIAAFWALGGSAYRAQLFGWSFSHTVPSAIELLLFIGIIVKLGLRSPEKNPSEPEPIVEQGNWHPPILERDLAIVDQQLTAIAPVKPHRVYGCNAVSC